MRLMSTTYAQFETGARAISVQQWCVHMSPNDRLYPAVLASTWYKMNHIDVWNMIGGKIFSVA